MIYAVNIVGVVLLGFIVYWFWLYGHKKAVVSHDNQIQVVVDGGVYQPAQIEMQVGQPLTLNFLRRDETPCAATVVFADFNQSLDLPLGKIASITITADKPGEYLFSCQMGMYRGWLRARASSS